MSLPPAVTDNDLSFTQDRELGRLAFIRRVLEQAADTNVPLLERLRFFSIFSDNLDEFFMVRIGKLQQLRRRFPRRKNDKSGLTPSEQIDAVCRTVSGLLRRKQRIFADLCRALANNGVHLTPYTALKPTEKALADQQFYLHIFPRLHPLVSRYCVPFLANGQLSVTALLEQQDDGRAAIGIAVLPTSLPPFLILSDKPLLLVCTEEVILHHAAYLFAGYTLKESCLLRITRSAYLSLRTDRHGIAFRSYMQRQLDKQKHLPIVRLEISRLISKDFMCRLSGLLRINRRQISIDKVPLDRRFTAYIESLWTKQLSSERLAAMRYPPYKPKLPPWFSNDCDVIGKIQKRDRLLFFPFDAAAPFLKLLEEAARREDSISVKITLYRVAPSSQVVQLLCRAAQNGKKVVVLVELRARFDEENNLRWSRRLEEAGCQVLHGSPKLKCHGKLCVITLKNGGHVNYITQIGTGNYNEVTNRQYTDFSLLTANDAIGADAEAFFHLMQSGSCFRRFQALAVAPYTLRWRLYALIDAEAAKGGDGYICIKANALTDRGVIDRLQAASHAGVNIRLIIRTSCCLLPDVRGKTDTVKAISIVGRFLEHARLYCFGRGEASTLLISSADLMKRNLERRFEIACPVNDPAIKRRLLSVLQAQWADTANARALSANGIYCRRSKHFPFFDSYAHFMSKNPSTPDLTKPLSAGILLSSFDKGCDRKQ